MDRQIGFAGEAGRMFEVGRYGTPKRSRCSAVVKDAGMDHRSERRVETGVEGNAELQRICRML